jgi:dienelactone hydrolase
MATPTLTKHTLPGALGEILVDVRAGGRESARPAVLVVHGWKGFKDWGMFPVFGDRLAQAGFTAVACNLSGSGVDDAGDFSLPERFARDTYSAELSDVAAVLDALTEGALGVAAPSSIGLVGHSRGGAAAILQTARDPRVRALVTWAAIGAVDRWSEAEKAEWRAQGRRDVINSRTGQVLPLYLDVLDDVERNASALDLRAAAARIEVPWLVAHGVADESVPADEARALHAASGRPTTQLMIVDGAGHTFGAVHPWAGMTPALREVFDRTVGWLARGLG